MEYITGTAICPTGTRQCVSPPAIDCGCIGQSSGPCRVSSTGVCYEKSEAGVCPAGTAECTVPSLNTLDIDTEAALLQFELAGVNVEDEELMQLLIDSISTSANVAEGQVVILGIASVLEDSNSVATLDNSNSGRAVVASVLLRGIGAGESVAAATTVASQVTSLGDSIVVSGMRAEVNVVGASASAAGQEADETGTPAASGSNGFFTTLPTLVIAMVAAVVLVAAIAVVVKLRARSANRVHAMQQRVTPVPPTSPIRRVAMKNSWMQDSTNVNPIGAEL